MMAGLIFLMLSAAAFHFFYFQPKLRALGEIDGRIDRVNEDLKEQRMLSGVFPSIKEIAHELNGQCETIGLRCGALSEPNGVDRGKHTIEDILTGIRAHAKGNGFSVKRAVPIARTVSPEYSHFKVMIDLTGDYRQIKAMLADIPFIEHIETLEVQSNPDGVGVSLLVWIGNDQLY